MTVLIERSIQDVVFTCREVNNLPKLFLKHFNEFVFSLVLQIASGKLRSPQLIIGLFL